MERFSEEVSVYSLQPEHYYFIVRYSMNQTHGIIYKGMFLENDLTGKRTIQPSPTFSAYLKMNVSIKHISMELTTNSLLLVVLIWRMMDLLLHHHHLTPTTPFT